MNRHKKQSFDILIGEKIVKYTHPDKKDSSFSFESDKYRYDLSIDDDGPQNDSHAYINYISNFDGILNKEIISVNEHSESYGAEIKIDTAYSTAEIDINHDHNGYYGFSYELYRYNKQTGQLE